MRHKSTEDVIGIIVLTLLIILMGYGFWNQGLFYRGTYVLAGLLTSLLSMCALPLLLRLTKKRLPTWAWFLVGYGVYVSLTCAWGADRTLAISGAVAIGSAVVLTLVVTLLGTNFRRVLLEAIVISGLALYLFAQFVALGWVQYEQAIEGTMIDSVFQYHNAFGAYELACSVIALSLSAHAVGYRKVYYSVAASISLVGLVVSYSRWVWIETVLFVLLYVLVMIICKKTVASLVTLLMTLLLVAGQLPFVIQLIQHHSVSAFMYGLLTIAVLGALYSGAYVAVECLKPPVWVRYIALAGGVVVAIVAGILLFMGHLTPIINRVQAIQIGDFSLQERLWYYGAAFKMWLANPVFGGGYGTWAAKYQAYQQFTYSSTMTHSSLMENLTNFGAVGTVLWIFAIVSAVVWGTRQGAKDAKQLPLTVAALLGAIAILIHSLFDFDLDYIQVIYVFWMLLAVSSPPGENGYVNNWVLPTTAYISTALISIIGVGLAVSEDEINAFPKMKTNTNQSIRVLTHATALAPYNAGAQYNLAQLEFQDYSTTKDAADLSDAWSRLKKAAYYGKWNSTLEQDCAVLAYEMGHYPDAYSWALQGTNDAPYQFDRILTFQNIALWTGVREWTNNASQAREIFGEVESSYSGAQAKLTGLKHLPKTVHPEWMPQITAGMQVYAGAAQYCLGKYAQSQMTMSPLLSQGHDQSTQELYEITTLLDQAKMHRLKLADAKLQLPNAPGSEQLFDTLASIDSGHP